MRNATIELMVDDMQKTIDFYSTILNFKAIVKVPESNPFFTIIKNGDLEIMLYSRNEFSKEIPKLENMNLGGSFVLYIGVDNVKELYNTISKKVTVIQELHKTNYGSLEFSMEDINGYVLMFNQKA
jgi:lactoylglutathione lyase